MDIVRRLIFLLLLLMLPVLANANYTPPVKYKLVTSYGGGYAGSKSELCLAAMPLFSASNYAHDPLVSVHACNDNTGQTGQTINSAWYDIAALYRTKAGGYSSWATIGYAIQECGLNTRVSGYPPNVICSGTLPNPCTPSDTFPAAYYTNLCVGGCEQNWNGQYIDMLGVKYYGAIGNTGSECATGTGNGTSMQSAWDANKAAAEQKLADDKAAADAAAKAAADAKTAADKAAAQAAAQAAEEAKQDAQAAKEAADKAAADKAAVDADANATQEQKDAAAAIKAAADALAASTAQAAAVAVGNAAAAQKDDTQPEQKDFCEKNPNSFICKSSNISTGTCSNGQSSGYNCDGDAIFCAMAKTQLDQHCHATQKDDALETEYKNMKSENGSKNPAASANITNVNLPTALNQSGAYAAQCIPDLTVSFNGGSVNLPFSEWCPILEALGYLFLACAYLSAAAIIGGKS